VKDTRERPSQSCTGITSVLHQVCASRDLWVVRELHSAANSECASAAARRGSSATFYHDSANKSVDVVGSVCKRDRRGIHTRGILGLHSGAGGASGTGKGATFKKHAVTMSSSSSSAVLPIPSASPSTSTHSIRNERSFWPAGNSMWCRSRVRWVC
jgi:hypothetical protein